MQRPRDDDSTTRSGYHVRALDSRHCVFSSGFCDDRNRHRGEPWKESPTHTPLPRGLLGETREGADVVARKRSFAAALQGSFFFYGLRRD